MTIWEETKLNTYPKLNQNIETDVLVIGGGICGILCAYRLVTLGHKVVLVEKNKIASSRTNKTTAVATALQDLYYSDLGIKTTKHKSKLYLEANLDAINEYKKLSKKYDFDCEIISTFKYFTNEKMLEKEANFLKEIGFQPNIVEETCFLKNKKALEFPNQIEFNPLKLIKELSKDIEIYEQTEIIKIDNGIAYTKDFGIIAHHIIMTTGYPFPRFKGLFFQRLIQHKSYVMAIDNVKLMPSSAIGELPKDLYFRTYKNYLIVGSSDKKTGHYNPGFKPIKDYLQKNYPFNKIRYSWVNQDTISADGLPYIGKFSNYDNVYVATGFNLWGMTASMLSSIIISDLIENKPNKYAGLFTPKRRTPILQLCKNVFTAIFNMLNFKKRCGHLGCGLFYNEAEQVYECPCHGTKYSKDGEIIFNPAQKNK